MVKTLNRIWMARSGSAMAGFAIACFAIPVATGCAARVYSESAPASGYASPVEEDGIVYVSAVPPNIEAYPRYSYGGGDAYYVDGRWYRRGPRGWGYYREEPPQLARQRPNVAVQAPPPLPPVVISRGVAPPPPPVVISRERSDAERAPAAPHEHQEEQQAPAHDAPHERHDAERAPAAVPDRSRGNDARSPLRPHSSPAEVPPHSGEHPADAPRRDRAGDKPPAPQKEHER
ncbi:MAG: hypothetical protein M3O50_19240 [Myxococcota bacterium]|nr:hypothetical protein [Myxococcota bacterium]